LKEIGTETGLTFHGVNGRYLKVVPAENKKAYTESRGIAPLRVCAFLL
jgi:hypothetical protein